MEEKRYQSKIITIPNILSLFRICLIPVIAGLYCSEVHDKWAGYFLILSGLTDVVDGFIARKYQMISNLGKVLDPVADKLTQTAMLICLLLRYPLMVCPLVLMVVKELFMAVTGLMIIKWKGVVLGANWHGKAATVMLYCTMFLHVFWSDIPALLSDLSIAGCTGFIGLSFVLYGIRNLGILMKPRVRY